MQDLSVTRGILNQGASSKSRQSHPPRVTLLSSVVLCGIVAVLGRLCWNSILFVATPRNHGNRPQRIASRTSSRAVLEIEKQKIDDDAFDLSPLRREGFLDDASVDGSLVHFEDTYRIVRDGDQIPRGASLSKDRVEPLPSEYGNGLPDGPQAWMSRSQISFDYRVVEVPRGDLLDPFCDALLFGHLEAGSPERQAAMAKPQRRLLVVDETVYDFIADKLKTYFETRGAAYEILVLNMVEDEKSMDLVLEVAKAMKKFNIDRRSEPVIAIGGGVALDIVGLAASLFRRRTPYIRVPTTALSYVDASVGAKSGVNYMGSKNILGAYVPPVAAFLDSALFVTESHRRIANALAEMAKMAIMKSPELFELLEDNADRLIADKFVEKDSSDGVPARVLRLSIETMLEELAPNLWEHSLDRLVDYGHAIGQNLEMKSLGTKDELMHGEAVAVTWPSCLCWPTSWVLSQMLNAIEY